MSTSEVFTIFRQCILYIVDIIVSITEPLKQLQRRRLSSSTEHVIANTALLMANGCPKQYLELLKAMYENNHLDCPDADILDTLLLSTNIYNPVKIAVNNTPSVEEHLDDVHPSITECSQAREEMLQSLQDVEEIPASYDEVQDILMQFSTPKELPVTFEQLLKELGDLSNSDDEKAGSQETVKVGCQNNFYALTDIDDWFDEDSYVHNSSAPILNHKVQHSIPDDHLAATAPVPTTFLNRTVSVKSIHNWVQHVIPNEEHVPLAPVLATSLNQTVSISEVLDYAVVLTPSTELGITIMGLSLHIDPPFSKLNSTFTQDGDNSELPKALASSTPITSPTDGINVSNLRFTLQESSSIRKRSANSTFSSSKTGIKVGSHNHQER